MSIKIKTERIINGAGRRARKITEIEALEGCKLPQKYLNGDSVYQSKDKLHINFPPASLYSYYQVGIVVKEKQFQELLSFCLKAGNNLQKVNKDLAERRAGWHGEETFII